MTRGLVLLGAGAIDGTPSIGDDLEVKTGGKLGTQSSGVTVGSVIAIGEESDDSSAKKYLCKLASKKELKKMKITLERTPEQTELIKAMASKNRDVAYEAQTALAEFIGPVLAEVVNATLQSATCSLRFSLTLMKVLAFLWTFITTLLMKITFRF